MRSRGVEVACWAIGLVLVSLYAIARADALLVSRHATASWELAMHAPHLADWSDGRRRAYQESLGKVTGTQLGVLHVPSVDLKVPLYQDARELHLNRGVGVIEGTGLPGTGGNLGIAGHRDGFFRVLQDIRRGDRIDVITSDALYGYRVATITIVDRADASSLVDTDDPVVTLVTCYPFYFIGHAPKRFVVRGVLESNERRSS